MVNRPVNREELYNLRHSSARNVIEQIFGILKKRFYILTHAPEYSMAIQARIPPALCAIHNFIRIYDPTEIHEFDEDTQELNPADQDVEVYGDLARGPAGAVEKSRAEIKRDGIAQAMWESYQQLINNRLHDDDE